MAQKDFSRHTVRGSLPNKSAERAVQSERGDEGKSQLQEYREQDGVRVLMSNLKQEARCKTVKRWMKDLTWP